MHKSLFLTLCFGFIVWVNCSLAQPVNNLIKDVVLPAPNAAALGKYGDIPVGNYSGTPGISIPIYTVEEGPLRLPLAVNYHASGHKVGETASWVGLGWSLQAGGMITRTVLGIADEEGFGYYNNGDNLSMNDTTVEKAGQGEIDSQPDLFTFNVSGYTGKFYLDKDNQPFLMPKQDLVIEVGYASNKFNHFTIITPDGNKFHFGNLPGQTSNAGIEYSSVFSGSLFDGTPLASTWYLVRMETFDGAYQIDLEYEDEWYAYKNLSSCSITYYPISECLLPNSVNFTDNCSGFSDDGGTTWYTRVEMDGLRLSKISSSTTDIDFIPASQARTDLDSISASYPAAALDEIQISMGNYCSAWEFFYDYFESDTPGNKSENYRLKLDSLQQRSCNSSISIPAHQFSYYGTSNPNGSAFMPGRLSKAIDHWGYYNGQAGNDLEKFNLPPTTLPYEGLMRMHGNSIRETDSSEVKIGVLDEIIYPTGGRTVFEFEAHQHTATLSSGETDLLDLFNCEDFDASCCGSADQIANYSFTQYELDYAKFIMSIRVRDNVDDCSDTSTEGCLPCSDSVYHSTTIEVWDGGTKIGECNIDANGGTDYEVTDPPLPLDSLSTALVANKSYQFRLKVRNGRGNFRLFTDIPSGITADQFVGGVRVKSIRTSADDTLYNAEDIVRTYEYIDPDDNDKLSGKLFIHPEYAGDVTVLIPGGSERMYGEFRAMTLAPLAGAAGTHIGYESVVESHNGNGKKVIRFHVDQMVSVDPQFLSPPLDVRPLDSHLKSESVYEESGTLKTQTTTKARQLNFTPFPGITFKAVSIGEFNCEDFSIYRQQYFPITDAYLPDSVSIEQDGVVTTTKYTYSDQHLNPTAVEMTNSNDHINKTTTNYIFDLPAGQLKDSLIAQNRILPPISNRLTVENDLVDGDSLQYAFYSTGGLPGSGTEGPYPHQFYRYETTWDTTGTIICSSDCWQEQGTIDEYDITLARPTKYTKDGWEQESYVWDPLTGLIAQRQYQDFQWSYTYHSNSRLLASMTDIDDQVVNYQYDDLMRLSSISTRSGNVVSSFDYQYQGINGNSHNYIKTTVDYNQQAQSGLDIRRTLQYFDGLGRPWETVEQGYSEAGWDVVSLVEYDSQGRVAKSHEPYEVTGISSGNFADVAAIASDSAFTRTEYEASPLNRVFRITPPEWHPSETTYGTNAGSVTVGPTSYPANSLNVITVKDANLNQIINYTDKKGRQVMSSRTGINGVNPLNTKYIYDDKDRLQTVLPPDVTSSDADLLYRYTYDGADNILSKKIPDQSAVQYLYDTRDLLTFMQDGNMAAAGRWLHTKYDDYGRSVETGFINTTTTLTGNDAPNYDETLTRTCYDGCDFTNPPGIYLGKVRRTETRLLNSNDWLQSLLFYDADGRIEKTETNHHLDLANLQAEVIDFSYDFADNLTVQLRSHNLNGITTTIRKEMEYDHVGRLTENRHQVNGGTMITTSALSYTAKDELAEKNVGKVGASFLQSIDYEYLENGFLTAINPVQGSINPINPLGGTTLAMPSCANTLPNPGSPAADPDQNDLFFLDLKYDDGTGDDFVNVTSPAQKNGNIAQLIWQVRGRERQAYGFTYDAYDRLTIANYKELDTPSGNHYLTFTSYDDRGNIIQLDRDGRYWDGSCWQSGKIDDLTYQYISGTNRLQDVQEGAASSIRNHGYRHYDWSLTNADYKYDDNGNMIYDPSKGITVTYNYLNLPQRVEFDDCKFIEFQYDAGGTKHSKTVNNGTVELYSHDYIGGIEYRYNEIEAIYHQDGRVYFENGTSRYEYAIRDHLGNTRLCFTDKDGDGRVDVTNDPATNEVLEETHYYPFGMAMEGAWMENGGRENRYLYNGKEFDEEFGLNWYHYGFRMYDPALGRFTGVDPISDRFPQLSTYNYASNDPISNVDLHGLQGIKHHINAALEYLGLKPRNFQQARTPREVDRIQRRRAAVRAAGKDWEQLADIITAVPGGGMLEKGVEGDVSGVLLEGAGEILGGGLFGLLKSGKKARKAADGLNIEESDDLIGGIFKSSDDELPDIEFLAEKAGDDETLHLKDIAIYADGAEGNELKNKYGKSIFKFFKGLMDWAREKGYKRIKITGERVDKSSSANPGKQIDIEKDLE